MLPFPSIFSFLFFFFVFYSFLTIIPKTGWAFQKSPMLPSGRQFIGSFLPLPFPPFLIGAYTLSFHRHMEKKFQNLQKKAESYMREMDVALSDLWVVKKVVVVGCHFNHFATCTIPYYSPNNSHFFTGS